MKRSILIILIIAALALTSCKAAEDSQPATDPPVRYSVTELIGYNPNTREVHYRTTYSNGLIIDRWTTESEENYVDH